MNVSLTPELEEFISAKVQTGLYQTSSEVVRAALRILKRLDEDRLAQRRQDVEAGFSALDHGEYDSYGASDSKKFVADIKARGRSRLGASQKTNERLPPFPSSA